METAKDTKQPAGFGPGKALRQARLDLRLSPQDVATQLHLAPRQILALEEDDFNALPQSTYVRGYLRSYALLLGLSPDPILEAYGRMHVAPKPAIGRERAPHDDHHQQNQVRIATYVVGALVLVLVLAWWQGADKDELTPPPSSSTTSTTPALVYSPTPPVPAVGSGENASTPPAGGETKTTPLTPTKPDAPVNSARLSGEAPHTATAESPPAAPKLIDRSVRTPSIDPSLPRARLVFNAEQESWVDVRDARENRLLYETVPAGRIVAVEGVPPFNVFLGNVDGVVVYVDGKVYDARKYKRGATARFSLGAGAAQAGAVPAPSSVGNAAPKPRAPRPTPPMQKSPAPAPAAPVPTNPSPETSTPPAASPAPQPSPPAASTPPASESQTPSPSPAAPAQ